MFAMRPYAIAAIAMLGLSPLAYALEEAVIKPIDSQTMAQLRAISYRWGPDILMISLPGNRDIPRMDASSIPVKAKSDALAWIRKVVNEKWLPRNWESDVFGLKNVMLWEQSETSGMIRLEQVRDVVMLDKKVNGYEIAIMETGMCVALRIGFPSDQNTTSNTAAFIEKCLREFVNIPSDKKIQEDLSITAQSPMITAESISGRAKLKEKRICPDYWWEYPFICANERFFFVVVVEFTPEDAQKQYCRPWNPHRF
ncbi:MAG: hypothetical protein NTX50_25085 [Candidatus Sumerlaeota bacterium]|nr:hypothetical protein [Candidatus Sumerlaeota bacterium]